MTDAKARAVGDSVRSMCTKCKAEARHIIVSVVDGQPARVQCTVCYGFHRYRPAAKAKPAAHREEKAPARASKPKRLGSIEEEWLSLMHGRDPKQAVPYPTGTNLRSGDLVEHPSFGFGLVRKVIPPNKIEVHFRDGIRLLRWEA